MKKCPPLFPSVETARLLLLCGCVAQAPLRFRLDMRTPLGSLDPRIMGVLNLAWAIDLSSLRSGAIFACCLPSAQDLSNSHPCNDCGKQNPRSGPSCATGWRETSPPIVSAWIASVTCVHRYKRTLTCNRRRHLLDSGRAMTLCALWRCLSPCTSPFPKETHSNAWTPHASPDCAPRVWK